VPPFRASDEPAGGPRLLIVGLAPGLRGANRTGRPFTGDFAGDTLYAALTKHGFARGSYAARPDDGLQLVDCRITNAVRCVPPENKPVGQEITACRPFLAAEIAGLTRLQVILALGAIAHQAVLASLKLRQANARFGHGALHPLPGGVTLADSYHCSRYNTNTGRLTIAMFDDVIATLRALLERVVSGRE
jgi:uracil-DNA glycosylase family 4